MYTILRTEKAYTQIRNIVYYIANASGSVERALGVLDMLEKTCRTKKSRISGAGCRKVFSVL